MTPYNIIAVVWIIFLITWIVSAHNVKRDIGRG
jgi:hypothetical protein